MIETLFSLLLVAIIIVIMSRNLRTVMTPTNTYGSGFGLISAVIGISIAGIIIGAVAIPVLNSITDDEGITTSLDMQEQTHIDITISNPDSTEAVHTVPVNKDDVCIDCEILKILNWDETRKINYDIEEDYDDTIWIDINLLPNEITTISVYYENDYTDTYEIVSTYDSYCEENEC